MGSFQEICRERRDGSVFTGIIIMGFLLVFLKEKPQLVTAVPLAVSSAVAGALSMLLVRKGCGIQKVGLSMVLGGALSNLYDRFNGDMWWTIFHFHYQGLRRWYLILEICLYFWVQLCFF